MAAGSVPNRFDWLAEAGVPPLGTPELAGFLERRGLDGYAALGARWALFMRMTGWSSRRLAAALPPERRPEPKVGAEFFDTVAEAGLSDVVMPPASLESEARRIRRYVERARKQLADR